ncbi:MAG: PQQ-binding-like beta-propeller repeat protein [Planctomycetota bacterium]
MDQIEARDLETGALLWTAQVPWGGVPQFESAAWIAGVRDGRVFALRTDQTFAGQAIHAFDATTGAALWTSPIIDYVRDWNGAVFAPDGDLVISGGGSIARIDAPTGALVWSTAVIGSSIGDAGAAIFGDAVYATEATFPSSSSILRLDLATGALQYVGAEAPSVTAGPNPPFCGPDGTVYWPRVSGSTPPVLLALEDDGTSFRELWSFPMLNTRIHQHGIGPDGSIYTFDVDGHIVRLDPATGSVLHRGPALFVPNVPNQPITLVDRAGTVYVSNALFADTGSSSGRLWSLSPDLAEVYFELVTDAPDRGGPALGGDGVLAIMDRNGVRAYRELDVGTALCTMIRPNSTGQFGETVARGSVVAADDRLHLTARNLPLDTFGYFIVSQGFDPLATAGGSPNFCLDGSIGRYVTSVLSSGTFGRFSQVVDLNAIPQPTGAVPGLAGQTWYFQGWHRDAVGGVAASDFSHVVAITLQ